MLPKEYGSASSTCHRRFQEWMQLGIFDKLWSRLLKLYDNRIGIKWNWQSLDSISIKSPLGVAMTGNNHTDSRSKLGSKRHDIFLQIKMVSPFVYCYNICKYSYDVTVAIDTVDSIVIKRQSSSSSSKQIEIRKRSIIYVLTKHIIPKK